MDDSYFQDYDKSAFEKHQIILERRAILDPPPPGPTSEELYRNVTLHKSSHQKKYEHAQAILESKRGRGGSSLASSNKTGLHSKVKSNQQSSNRNEGETRDQGGSSVDGSVSVGDNINASVTSCRSSSSQVLLEVNRVPVSDEEAHKWLLARGFDPEMLSKPKPHNWSALLQCGEEGHLGMLIWLFEKAGSNVEDLRKTDDAGITLLQLASMRRDLPMCRWLNNQGAAEVYMFNPFL